MTVWVAVLSASAIALAVKLAGYGVPRSVLEQPRVLRVGELLPAALLASLVVLQTVATGSVLELDARLAGLAVAAVALLLRAPFVLVVVAAALTAALLRMVGWR